MKVAVAGWARMALITASVSNLPVLPRKVIGPPLKARFGSKMPTVPALPGCGSRQPARAFAAARTSSSVKLPGPIVKSSISSRL